ncbi:hypothetical protein AY599_20110 [Leptolyngbya valderiana BDU 20041]|nr:hypothetical protein AY599_20110 [Leptolyngbya valderiana BDU 20041]
MSPSQHPSSMPSQAGIIVFVSEWTGVFVNRYCLALTAAFAALPLTAGAEADADAADSTPTLQLAPMVISATRTPRPQFSTPAAISRVDAEDIARIQPYGYQDVFETIPGVNIFGGPRRIAEEPSIRGFADEQVAIRIDGARQNFNKAHGGRFLLDPDLIESVEVLRGASSSLYGSGALGGAFIIETSSGRSRLDGMDGYGLRLSAGHDSNGDQWRAGLTGYGQQGRFDWLASISRRDVGEDLQDGGGEDILATRDEIGSGLIKLGFQVDPDQRLEFSHERFENEGVNPTNSNAVASPSTLVDRTTERVQNRFRYRNSDPSRAWLDLTATAYINEVDTLESRFRDGRIDRTDFRTAGLDLANTMELGRVAGQPVRLTLGGELYKDEQSGSRNGQDRPQFPDAEVDYQALFAQLEIELGAGVSLIPGIRHDRFDYRTDGDLFGGRDDSQTSPRLALGWQATESSYFWAEYAEAFRAPSLTELYADGVHFVVPLGPGQVVINEFMPTPDLESELSSQIQLGARWQSERLGDTDFRLDLEATVHRSDIDDYVDQFVLFISGEPTFDPMTQTLIFPGLTTNRNVDARIEGAELSARLTHPRGYLNLAMTLLDGEQRNGGELASLQSDRLSLGAGVRMLDGQVGLGGEVILSRARDDVPEGALSTPGYAKADLYASWMPARGALSGFEFRLGLDNVFDKDFRIHPNAIDQPGRSVRLSVAREFQWLN